jgi:hypothetical protein
MKLVHEKNANLLVRTHCVEGPNNPLLPGDMVRHMQDKGSSGMVIAVSHDARVSPDLEVLVLWSKLPFNGNYPFQPSPPMPASTNPCAEVTLAEVMKLHEMKLISRESARRMAGFDPVDIPYDDE